MPQCYDYSERALDLADQILDLSSDLRTILLAQARETDRNSARRGLALLVGGDAGPAPQDPEGVVENVRISSQR